MEQSKIAQQQELNALLNQYRHEYYNLNAPTVSDEVYDRLFDKLRSASWKRPFTSFPCSRWTRRKAVRNWCRLWVTS